jgi:hypothetical protein
MYCLPGCYYGHAHGASLHISLGCSMGLSYMCMLVATFKNLRLFLSVIPDSCQSFAKSLTKTLPLCIKGCTTCQLQYIRREALIPHHCHRCEHQITLAHLRLSLRQLAMPRWERGDTETLGNFALEGWPTVGDLAIRPSALTVSAQGRCPVRRMATHPFNNFSIDLWMVSAMQYFLDV